MCENAVDSKGRRKILGGLFFWPTLSFAAMNGVLNPTHAKEVSDSIKQPDQQNPASYLKRAAELARSSVERGDGTRYGAVIVKNGLIVGEGRNRTYLLNDPTAHSEIDAIRDACRRLNVRTLEGCDIYCSARPCPMCSSACYWARLGRIYVDSGNSKAITIEPSYSRC